jgi:N utilization substance protein A
MSSAQSIVRTDFAAAVVQIAEERKIEAEDIYEAIRQALISAYRKQIGDLDGDFHFFVELDKESGAAKFFKHSTKIDEETLEVLEWDENKAEVTPAGFGRIAAQQAKQVILQKFV